MDENGNYKIEYTLPKGMILSRYGNGRGRLTTPKGTEYSKLGLPYDKDTIEYHEYKVIADGINVTCVVTKGIVAPMFDSMGGGVQFKHHQSIDKEVRNGKLREVDLWK